MGKGCERFQKEPHKIKAVWWDINTCPIPEGLDPRCVRPMIEIALNKSSDFQPCDDEEVTIFAFGDLLPLTPSVRKTLSSSGIFMRHTAFESSDRISFELGLWQLKNPPPATLMVISDNPFADFYFHAELRYGNTFPVLVNGVYMEETAQQQYTVIPAYPTRKSRSSWRWSSILKLEAPPLLKIYTHMPHKNLPLWDCLDCVGIESKETDTYSLFIEHLVGRDHYVAMFCATHFAPKEFEIFYKFKEDFARMIELEGVSSQQGPSMKGPSMKGELEEVCSLQSSSVEDELEGVDKEEDDTICSGSGSTSTCSGSGSG